MTWVTLRHLTALCTALSVGPFHGPEVSLGTCREAGLHPRSADFRPPPALCSGTLASYMHGTPFSFYVFVR